MPVYTAEPLLPTDTRARLGRWTARVISGIVHVLKFGDVG